MLKNYSNLLLIGYGIYLYTTKRFEALSVASIGVANGFMY